MFKLLRDYLRPYAGHLLVVFLLQILSSAASLYLPNLNARIIDDGIAQGDQAAIWSNGLLMLAGSLAQIAAQIAAAWFGARAAMGFGRDVRAAVFDRVLSFSTRELNRFGPPSLITRNTNDVQQVQMFVLMTSVMMLSAPIMMIGGVFMAIRTDVGLSWLVAVAVGVMALVIVVLISQMLPLFRSQQTRIDTLNRVLREQITGLRVIRAYVREPFESHRFDDANSDLTQTQTLVGRRIMTLFPTVGFILNVSSVGVLWFGAFRIDSGVMGVGELTAFLSYLMQILMSVMMASMMMMMGPRAAVCARRIQEVMETSSSVKPPAKPVFDVTGYGDVTLEDVGFTYPGAELPVLSTISFSARTGQTTAIVGSTGSGKTTLINLLPRLFDATAGVVRIDGVDVRELDPDVLWAHIGLVPQKPYLFTGTVASNLRYGKPDATDEELWHALEVAQARDFVEKMPGGLNAPITQGGTNVSGGQRQRISIARALVKKPDIYIFDDAFSALDVATDARLRAALVPETRDAAVLIVAQRVATIRHADRILVLEDGRLIGNGTHEQLLETCPTYGEIVASQFSLEEVA